jgi:hypothetical protein
MRLIINEFPQENGKCEVWWFGLMLKVSSIANTAERVCFPFFFMVLRGVLILKCVVLRMQTDTSSRC